MQRFATKSFSKSIFSYTAEQVAQDPGTVLRLLKPATPIRFFHDKPIAHGASHPSEQTTNPLFSTEHFDRTKTHGPNGSQNADHTHSATGFFVFMASMAVFLYLTYEISENAPNTSPPEECEIKGDRINDHPLVYDHTYFITRGEKLEGHLTGEIVQGMFSGKLTSFISKHGASKTRMALEVAVSSIFEHIYAHFEVSYPHTILIQSPIANGSENEVSFMTASEILPNTTLNLEQFLKQPDVFEKLDKKPLKGLGVAIALNRIYGDVDIKLPNFIVSETADSYLILPIDHECALNYSPCFVTPDEPIARTLQFVSEFAHASSQSRMSLTNDPELMSLLLRSIEEDRKHSIPKLYEITASLDMEQILKTADPLQVFASVPQFQKIQARVQESLIQRDPTTGLPVQFMARPINRASRFLNMINSGHLGRGIESKEDRLY